MSSSFEPRVLLILCGVLVLIFLVYCRMTRQFNSSLRGYIAETYRVKAENSISYVYVVGVEGVGHRAVAPMIAKVGETCGYHIFYEHKALRNIQHSRNSADFQSIMQSSKTAGGDKSKKILVVEDAIFPAIGEIDRISSAGDVKQNGKYDIEWIYDQIKEVGDVKMRVIYLNRNFYRAVSSHAGYDGGFQQHANVMYTYIQHIQSEFELIHAKDPKVWGQVHYEWFAELQDCARLVSVLAAFLGLDADHCDVTAACERIHKHVHKETLKAVNQADKDIAATFTTAMTIPVLDYQP